MDREDSGFAFLQKFPGINMEKLKAAIFDCSQIRELMKDPMFDEALSKSELSIKQFLKSVVKNFLGIHPSAVYEGEIEQLQRSFR